MESELSSLLYHNVYEEEITKKVLEMLEDAAKIFSIVYSLRTHCHSTCTVDFEKIQHCGTVEFCLKIGDEIVGPVAFDESGNLVNYFTRQRPTYIRKITEIDFDLDD